VACEEIPSKEEEYKGPVAVFGFSYDITHLPGREGIGVLQAERMG
jgi:hypothetical protein